MIDVAGLQDVAVAASADRIAVTVRGNELRDTPLQRGGFLNSRTVWVNIHDLDKVAADRIYTAGGLLEVSGWLGLIARTIDERLTAGGSVSIQAGQAILRPGASIDISGGTLAHQGGMVNTTRLVGADGHIYDINSAPPDMVYTGIAGQFVLQNAHWGVTQTYISPLLGGPRSQAAYTEGKAAGSLSVNGRLATEMDATVHADAVNGIYQRSAGTMVSNGSLSVGAQFLGNSIVGDQNVLIAPTFAAPDDPFAGNAASAGAGNVLPTDYLSILHLSADKLNAAHYGSITVIGGGAATTVVDPGTGQALPSGISLVDGATLKVADGGSISLQSRGTITIDGQLVAHGGSDGGRGGLADIVGTKLEILGDGDTLTAGFTGISDSLIANIGAQSVLIGGVRTITQARGSTPPSLTIGQEAASVEIGSHAVLSAPEVMVRATDSLVLDPGAVIDITGASAIADAFPASASTGLSSGSINLTGGAFLLASNAPSTIPIALSESGTSSLSIGAGARIDATSSLALANQSSFSLDSTASFGAPSSSPPSSSSR